MENFPRKTFIALILFLGLVVFGSDLLQIYVNWLWFKEVQYEGVFKTKLFTKIQVGLVFGIAFFFLFFSSIYWALRERRAQFWAFLEKQFSLPLAQTFGPHLTKIIFFLSLIFSVFVGIRESNQWESYLLATHSTPFGRVWRDFVQDG